MTTEELQQLVADVQSRASELNDLEVKAANKGTPKERYKSLPAFANRPSGGVLLFGLDENKDFDVCGVWDAQRLQEEVTHAACEMEPPLRPIFTVDEIDGKAVVAAEIDELPTSPAPVSDEARILQYAREHGAITNEQCRNLLGVDEGRAWHLLKKMSEAVSLKPLGEGRWCRYAPGQPIYPESIPNRSG